VWLCVCVREMVPEVISFDWSTRGEIMRALHSYCVEEWPGWVCDLGNICGYISFVVQFAMFLPQLYKNYQRKCTDGLSFLWILSDTAGNLVNMFYVYHGNFAILWKVFTVYILAVDTLLIYQFITYSKNSKYYNEVDHHRAKLIVFVGICIAILVIYAIVMSSAYSDHWSDVVAYHTEWIAVCFWSAGLLPQLYVNFRESGTLGQSSLSVCLQLIGQLSDFGIALSLQSSRQFLIATFFASSTSLINLMQLVYYAEVSAIDEKYGKRHDNSLPKLMVWRVCGCLLVICLLILAVGLLWRAEFHMEYICCPIALYVVIYILYSVAVARRANLSALFALQKYFPKDDTYVKLLFGARTVDDSSVHDDREGLII
jgi:small-conductance mechanosensitive channel